MARRVPAVLPLLAVLAFGIPTNAQSSQPRLGTPAAVSFTPGQSLLPLNGPWKFHIGDSPVDPATHQPLWARPDFDDSTWETVDLTPEAPVNPYHSAAGAVPGWGSRGHEGYSGYAWYRIRIRVQPHPGEKLALAGPGNLDDAYQLFLNGSLAGSFGRFDGKRPEFFYAEPTVFPLPQAKPAGTQNDAPSDATEVIAFRFWMSPSSLLAGADAGGFHLAPLIGTADAVQAQYQLGWLDLARGNAVWALTAVVYSLLAAVAFTLFLFDRADRVYFWMGAMFFGMGLGGAETAIAELTQAITVVSEQWICNVLVIPLVGFTWVMLSRSWLRADRPRWLPWLAAALALMQSVAYAIAYDLLFPLVPVSYAPAAISTTQAISAVFGLMMIAMAIYGVRKRGVEGWRLVPPLLLYWGNGLARSLTFLHIPRVVYPFGIFLSLSQITGLLLALAMCALMVRRWVLSAQAQRVMALELKQAQEVQQVLIPDAPPQIPGFSIQSVYRPAGQVGGDFFQILPAKDGGVLVCIGDVSGKGMPAAMTVSLLVGTLRTLAHYTQSPAEILAAMNQRMLGRSRGGFTTCLALLAAPDGTVTAANAGHIPPYLNGREVPLEGGIPLGLSPHATYPESTFQQKEDEQLSLITDGVVEARSASGELFGFERTAAIAAQSAESISSAAQAFGQDDDITVLTITRVGAGKQSTAPQAVSVLSPSVA